MLGVLLFWEAPLKRDACCSLEEFFEIWVLEIWRSNVIVFLNKLKSKGSSLFVIIETGLDNCGLLCSIYSVEVLKPLRAFVNLLPFVFAWFVQVFLSFPISGQEWAIRAWENRNLHFFHHELIPCAPSPERVKVFLYFHPGESGSSPLSHLFGNSQPELGFQHLTGFQPDLIGFQYLIGFHIPCSVSPTFIK